MTGDFMRKYADKLMEINDIDKIKYLLELKQDGKLSDEFKIEIDNDNVYINFGYDKNENSIGVSFDEFGYHLLPTLFEFIGLESDFV